MSKVMPTKERSGSWAADGPLSEQSLLERLRERRKVWAAGAALLIVVRTAAPLAGGPGVQHEQDLVVSAAGFVVRNPDATEAEFAEWADSVHAFQRYPELTGFG